MINVYIYVNSPIERGWKWLSQERTNSMYSPRGRRLTISLFARYSYTGSRPVETPEANKATQPSHPAFRIGDESTVVSGKKRKRETKFVCGTSARAAPEVG
ncbi:hypothetical protein M404DRAFT_1002197 [Pisolithus tinctorius Marx 270]|uniref:Uncharacterized protein n=1 Tax=Pisolithus tinctorius Marx 270 TaxID=870435 RepID=A0A0C3P5K3_PISTI|nr:hypothetical protein M404DRAFT_1002197 [Pisolithus tinctorius Marx 270]